jgi:hypothetical protein
MPAPIFFGVVGMDALARESQTDIKTTLLAMGLKDCIKCSQVKPVNEFGPNRDAKDKLNAWCRECHRGKARERHISSGNEQALDLMRFGTEYDVVSLEELQEKEYRAR